MAGSKNKSFWQRVQNGVRDVFDANTEDDQIRRQQAGQPRYYQQQQAQQKNPTVRYGTNPVSQAVNRARDYVDANTAQDRAARLAQGRKELEQRTFQAKYAPFLKPAKQVWNVSTANPIMNPIGFAMKASEPIKPVHNLVGGVEQGVSRSLVGTAQSTAGLVDLLSPGTGQSTATKFLNKTAEGIDQNVKNNGYNNITYKGAQAATDVGTFLVPGAVSSKVSKVVEKGSKFVPGSSKAYNTVIKAMDTASKTLDDSGKIGQVTNKVGKFYLKPENAIDIGVDTGLNAGFRSARGEDNSLSTFGQDFGLSTAFSGGIGLGALGAKKAVTKLFKEKDIKQIAKSTDVNEIRNALEMRYPNLNSYELDRMAGDLVNKTTKKEVKGALEEAVVKDTAKGATLENTSETPTADVTQPTEGPTRLSDTNTVEGPTRLSDTNLTQTPAQATATIKQRYPQLDETKAAELDTRLNLAKTPEEKAIIELEAKARNDAIQAEVKQATSPQTVAPSQQAIEADTQVMADNTANVAPQAIKAPGEPNTKTMQDLQQLGVSQQDLENAQLPEIKQNPVVTGLINATEDLKKEGIPESAIDRAMKDPNAPSDPTEFKNFVRRIANTQTQSNDVLEVQRAMMEAYNRGDIETANMLNDSLRESGNNPLANNFPSPTNQVNPTPPINKQTNTANSTPAKTTVEVDSLYDGGKSSKDGSDLYGTPDGYKYTVEMPSQKDVETVRTKRAEYNANGSGFSSTKSDIVVKDEDGDVVRIIDYDKAVEKYGTTDPEKLANLAANQGVEPATPKPVAPKGVAPKSAPIEKTHPDVVDYNSKPKEGTIRLYTNTKGENVDSILKDGLLVGKATGRESAGGMTWFETTPNLKGYGGNTIAVDVPINARMEKVNNTQYTVFQDLSPDNIRFVDKPVFDQYRTSDIKGLVDKYGKDRVVEVFNQSNAKEITPQELNRILDQVAPVSAPIENPKAPEPSLATNNTEQKLGYVKKLSVEREMLLAQLDSKNGRMYGNQYTEIANRLDEIDQEINDYLYNAKPTPIKASDTPQAAPIEKTPTMSPEEEASLFNTRSAPETPTTNQVTGEVPFGKPEINNAKTYSDAHKVADGTDLNDAAPLQNRFYGVIDNFDADLQAKSGHSLDELTNAFDRFNKNSEDLPAWVTPEIQSSYKKMTDDFHLTVPENTGYRKTDFYVPESKPVPEGTPLKTKGLSVTSAMDTNFGFSKGYEGKIPLEELDSGVNRLKRWGDQSVNDKFKYAREAEKPEYAGFTKDGKSTAPQYLEGRAKIYDDIAKQSDELVNKKANNGKVVRGIAKDEPNIIDKLQENYKNNADNPTIQDNGAKVGFWRNISTIRDALDSVGFYKDSGFKRIDESYQTASHIHDSQFKNLDNLGEDELLVKLNDAFPKNDKIGDSARDDIINKLYDNLEEERLIAQEQGIPFEPSQLPFVKAERAFGAEELRHSLERTNFSDPKTKKFVNDRAVRALAGNRVLETNAAKVSREITSMFYSSLLGLKISTALQNLTEISRAVGVAGPVNTMKAMGQLAAHPSEVKNILVRNGQDRNFIKQGAGVADNIGPKTKFGKGVEGMKNFVMIPFNATESYKDAVFLKSLENKFSKQYSGRELGTKVAEVYNKTSFKGGEFGTLKGASNPLGSAVYQFAQYPIKDISLLAENMGKVLSPSNAGDRADGMKYLVGNYGTKAGMAVVAWYALGWSAQQTLGVGIPKAGPAISVPAGIITALNDEQQRSEDSGEPFNINNVYDAVGRKDIGMVLPGGDFLNQAGVLSWIANKVSNGNDPFIKEGTVQEVGRGYGVNKDGVPRMPGQETTFGKFKQFIGGKYNTNDAKKYFGQNPFSFKLDLPGDKLDINVNTDRRGRPLTKLEQEQFNKLGSKAEKNAYIRLRDQSHREQDTRWDDAYKNDPGVKDARNQLKYTVYNKDTKKNESDIITPEKWNIIQSDKSGKLFDNLAKDKRQQAKDFGLPLDPIYDGTLTKEQIKAIVELRGMYTGNDREGKEILDQTTKWYPAFKDKESAYYDALEKKGFTEDPDSKYGFTQRYKDYVKLGKEYPQDTPTVAKYKDIKKADEANGTENAKQFYKNNMDTIKNDYKVLNNQRFDWTNKRRAMEGTTMMERKVFDNLSYGYEDDEKKLASDLYWKNGGYGGKSGYTKFRSTSDQPTQYKLYLDQLLANDKNAKPISSLKIDTTPAKVKMKSFAPKAAKIKRIRIK